MTRLVVVLLALATFCPAQVITGVRHRKVESGGVAAFSIIANFPQIATSTSNTTAENTTGAKLIVIACGYSATPCTVADSKSNTWVGLTAQAGPTVEHAKLFCVDNPTTDAAQTFHSSAGSDQFIIVYAFSGGAGHGCANVGAQINGASVASSNSFQTGSVTPGVTGSVAISLIVDNASLGSASISDGVNTWDSAAVQTSNTFETGAASYSIINNNSATNPTWTTNVANPWAVTIAVFNP